MPKRAGKKRKPTKGSASSHLYLRLTGFIAIAVVVVAVVFVLLRPTGGAAEPGAIRVRVDMAGFEPNVLHAKVGVPVKVRLVNPDSQFHTDGGGKHQFAIPDLGVDVIMAPESAQVVTFTPTAAGTFAFYCDVCCGGKENPTMQGTLKVTV